MLTLPQTQTKEPSGDVMTARTMAWALEKLDLGECVALASVVESQGSVPGKVGAKIAVSENGERHGTVGGAGLEEKVISHLTNIINRDASPGIHRFQLRKEAIQNTSKGIEATPLNSLCGGVVTIVSEFLNASPHVLLAGGGHCAIAIGKMADVLDWRISIMDTREEYVSENHHPKAIERIHSSPENFLKQENSTSMARFTHILIMGHDWAIDQNLLLGIMEKMQDKEWNTTVGTIGSKAKWNSFSSAAKEKGIDSSVLNQILCPIGVDISAESPEEIAIAVCAQIIDERARSLRGETKIKHSGWRSIQTE
tara:strand:+ start:438 stop:1370 length:933 start_codon:yes stop_codon:yes gene_type:complete